MNAKELRLAAEHFKNRSYEESHEGYDEFCKDRVAILSHGVDHILATVHTDDAEPVTVEWMLSIGGEDRRNNSVPSIQFSGDSNVVLRYYPKLDVWHVSGSTWKPKNRGQLRHLLAGLGMGGGK